MRVEALGLELLGSIRGVVAVVGSLNADYSVRCERLPGPGETVVGRGLVISPGGKSSNQAACAALLGSHVRMVGAVGQDFAADFLVSELERTGVDAFFVSHMHGPSGTAVIEVDAAGENSIVVSPGANAMVSAGYVHTRRSIFQGAAVLGLSLEIPMEGVLEAARCAHAAGARVLLNDSPFVAELPEELVQLTDVLLVNEHELSQLLGMAEPAAGWLSADWEAVAAGLRELGFAEAIVTLGAEGSVVLAAADPCGTGARGCGDTPVDAAARTDAFAAISVGASSASPAVPEASSGFAGRVAFVEAVPVEAVDTTGCGDAYMGAVLAGLASGLSLVESAQLASCVSAYAAAGPGAQSSYGTPAQLRAFFA